MKYGLALLAILFTVAAQAQPGQPPFPGPPNTDLVAKNGFNLKFRFNGFVAGSNFTVESRGKVELTDDDKDIRSLSDDGYIEITKTVFGTRRKLVVTPTNGGVQKDYYEGRTKLPFDPDGRRWLADILPELVRSTTFGAESRVKRFFARGGTTAVLSEINNLESDYVKVHYGQVLMTMPVNEKDYPQIIGGVSGSLESDHYISEFLRQNIAYFLKTPDATSAVFTATRRMESDHYKTEVIKEGLRSTTITAATLQSVIEMAGDLESDHYKTEALTAVMRLPNVSDAAIGSIMSATTRMESDHYRTSVITRAMNKSGVSSATIVRGLEAVKEMESDHYRTEVLTSLLRVPLSADAQSRLIDATTAMESEHYITQVAKAIINRQTLTDDNYSKLLSALASHGNDFYTANFLKEALEKPETSKEQMMIIIKAAGGIDSDHYITEVLTAAAPRIKALNDNTLKDAYRQVAKKIGSEVYYGRALRAID